MLNPRAAAAAGAAGTLSQLVRHASSASASSSSSNVAAAVSHADAVTAGIPSSSASYASIERPGLNRSEGSASRFNGTSRTRDDGQSWHRNRSGGPKPSKLRPPPNSWAVTAAPLASQGGISEYIPSWMLRDEQLDKQNLSLPELTRKCSEFKRQIVRALSIQDVALFNRNFTPLLEHWAYFQRAIEPKVAYGPHRMAFSEIFSAVVQGYSGMKADHIAVALFHHLNRKYPSPPIYWSRSTLWNVLKSAHVNSDVDSEIEILTRMDALQREESERLGAAQAAAAEASGAAAVAALSDGAAPALQAKPAPKRLQRGVGRDELEALLIACLAREESAKALAVVGQLENLEGAVHPRVYRASIDVAKVRGHTERAAVTFRDMVRHEFVGGSFPYAPLGTTGRNLHEARAAAAAAAGSTSSSSAPATDVAQPPSPSAAAPASLPPPTIELHVREVMQRAHAHPTQLLSADDLYTVKKEAYSGRSLIDAAVARGDLNSAHHVAVSLLALGVHLVPERACTVLKSAGTFGHVPLAEIAIADLLRSGVRLGPSQWCSLIEAYARGGDYEGTLRTIQLYFGHVRPAEQAIDAALGSNTADSSGYAALTAQTSAASPSALSSSSSLAAATSAVDIAMGTSSSSPSSQPYDGAAELLAQGALPERVHDSVVGCAQHVMSSLAGAVKYRLHQKRRAQEEERAAARQREAERLEQASLTGSADADAAAEGAVYNVESSSVAVFGRRGQMSGYDVSGGSGSGSDAESQLYYGSPSHHAANSAPSMGDATSSVSAASPPPSGMGAAAAFPSSASANLALGEGQQQQQEDTTQQVAAASTPTIDFSSATRTPRPSTILGFGFLHDPPGE